MGLTALGLVALTPTESKADDGFRVYVRPGYEQFRPYYYGDDRCMKSLLSVLALAFGVLTFQSCEVYPDQTSRGYYHGGYYGGDHYGDGHYGGGGVVVSSGYREHDHGYGYSNGYYSGENAHVNRAANVDRNVNRNVQVNRNVNVNRNANVNRNETSIGTSTAIGT